MKKYTLFIKFGKSAEINIDHAPDVTDEEFEKVLVELRKLNFDAFKFRPVDQTYVKDACDYIANELNNIGKVVYAQQISEFESAFAFMA